jgi:uncharacterized protein
MNNTFKIKIDDIENSPNKTLQINFEDFIDGVKSDEPIKATLKAVSMGDFIEITGQILGQVFLQCDLCLDEFKYELDFDIDELFAKNVLIDEAAESGAEIELKEGYFVTDLKGSNDIDICDLLYQSVILDFPNKKVCGINCKGNKFSNEENFAKNEADPRLAVFKTINTKEK